MNLLVVSHYFWPEAFIITDLVKRLVKHGHNVTVLTGRPNYPDGELFPGYAEPKLRHEQLPEGIDVFRVPLRPRGVGGASNLILNYLSFVWLGLRYFPRLVKNRDFDSILVFAPSPITQAIPAIFLKYCKRAHLAIWVQDLWPESLAATGFVRNRLILRAVGWMVHGIYACTDTLLVQSRAFIAPTARFARADKIIYYPNSIDPPGLDAAGDNPLPLDLLELLETHFCVVFAGNIGKAQAVETLVGAAARLKEVSGCKFVLVGSGSMVSWVRERKDTLGLDNLVLAGRFPMDTMPQIFRRAAALVVTLKDEEIFSFTVPSKLQAYLAAGKPIIAALNGEGARVVREAGAGVSCAAEDAGALAQCVRDLYVLPRSERERMGAAGYAYFLEHFEMNRQARRLVEILECRMAHTRGEG
ncbi:glycosyltransferase family 4 protein [Nitrococcus mobilis]|uniref:Glycosyl transferase, group 1 family protein n=1 Tax=Nitrococcus mobilis Nb-231 TaxID=314278 RepID=A4BMH4_9GAMM|nr:glycosyltransferase family 4 protein [Nitrococcus mobilis]EAR23512.1 glycosyl transferase, group 1 family protein [Nitrococcus mobilis Nb-231]